MTHLTTTYSYNDFNRLTDEVVPLTWLPMGAAEDILQWIENKDG